MGLFVGQKLKGRNKAVMMLKKNVITERRFSGFEPEVTTIS